MEKNYHEHDNNHEDDDNYNSDDNDNYIDLNHDEEMVIGFNTPGLKKTLSTSSGSNLSNHSNSSILSLTTGLINIEKLDKKYTIQLIDKDYQYICFNGQTSFPYVFVNIGSNKYESRRRYVRWTASELDNGNYLVKMDGSTKSIKIITREQVSVFTPFDIHSRVECFWYSNNFSDSVSILMSHNNHSLRTGTVASFGMISLSPGIGGGVVGPFYTIRYDFDLDKRLVMEDPYNVFGTAKTDKTCELPWHRDELLIAKRNYNDEMIQKLDKIKASINDWLELTNIGLLPDIKCFYSSPPLKVDAKSSITRKRGSYKVDEIETIINKIGGDDYLRHGWWATHDNEANQKMFYLNRMNVLVSNIDADKKEIDAIKANVNYYLNNNTVNSEILFYLLKNYVKYRCCNLCVPDIYALCGFYLKRQNTRYKNASKFTARTWRAYFIYVCAAICFMVQIVIPYFLLRNIISNMGDDGNDNGDAYDNSNGDAYDNSNGDDSNDDIQFCESSDDIMLKISGIMMYQTLFIGRISSHIVPELLPSYSFCSYWELYPWLFIRCLNT